MSTNSYKTALRIKIMDETDNKRVQDLLDRMNVMYDVWSNGFVGEIIDSEWDIYYGVESNAVYLDYVVGKNDYDNPFFDGVLGLNEIEGVLQSIPSEYVPEMNNIRIVTYGWYTGVDEPEVF